MNQLQRISDLIKYANLHLPMEWDRLLYIIDEDGFDFLVLEEDQYSCLGDYVDQRFQGPFDDFDDLEDFLVDHYTPGSVQVITL